MGVLGYGGLMPDATELFPACVLIDALNALDDTFFMYGAGGWYDVAGA
jgi:hypothetical protein